MNEHVKLNNFWENFWGKLVCFLVWYGMLWSSSNFAWLRMLAFCTFAAMFLFSFSFFHFLGSYL